MLAPPVPMTSPPATTDALVLHVVPTPTPRGAQREARALADHLDRPGRRHQLLTLFDGSGADSDVPTEHTLHRSGGARPAEGFDTGVMRALRRFLSELHPDVVVAHGSDPLKYLAPATLGRRGALVHYAIGTWSGTGGRVQLTAWRRLTARADAVAACGEDTFEECGSLLRVPQAKLSLVYNGRDPSVFRPRRAADRVEGADPLVVFVGALQPGKRPDRFVEAVRTLRARGAGLRAEVVGDGPLRPSLDETAPGAGVELLGSRDDVPALLRAADLLVFPSLPAGEGMPGVLIEAALSGVPVVATAVPGVRTVVEDGVTGSVVPVDDFDALVDATGALVADPARRAEMARAARRRAETLFSMDAVGERWLALLGRFLPAEAAVA
jgi:glycosyltransferase involved in cell wall biosynthesis